MTTIRLTINGVPVTAEVEPRTHLADFLREAQNLTGTHIGCEHGICGACTVVINGEIARSCITYAIACDGADIRTIESFDDDALMARLRQAFSEEHALQCGYCTPGMLVAARDLVRRKSGLDEKAIRYEMSGNLCRCTGYAGIVKAIGRVMAEWEALVAAVEPPARYLGPAPGLIGGEDGGFASSATQPAPRVPAARPDAARAAPPPAAQAAPGRDDDAGLTTLEQSFRVAHPRAAVWTLMTDIERVAGCLPGARLDGPPQEGRVTGTMTAKIGPISASFAGEGQVEARQADHTLLISGQGRDQKSASRARGRVGCRLIEEADGGTRVDVSLAYALTGPLAQFSRSGLVKDLVARLLAAFAQNLEAELAGPGSGTAPPRIDKLDAGSLVWGVLLDRLKALFARLLGRR
ncbi:MAG: 2Fe-2S iron-sulfur cluster-binding protein [Hyphomicrobiaceae bacterium]